MHMIQLESEFDQLFKARGGRYQGKFSDSDMFNHLLLLSRDLIKKIARTNPQLPDTYIDLIDNTSLNACATKNDSRYFIGFNAGAIFLIYDIFLRMMSSKNIFVNVGDVTKEADTKKIFNAQISDLTQLSLAKDPNEILAPVNFERILLAQLFIDTVIYFLTAHEYAHIIFGHVDYIQSVLGSFEIGEGEQKPGSYKSLDPLVSQTLELDADSFATVRGMEILNILFTNPDFSIPEARVFYTDWPSMIYMWTFAVYTFFRIFGYTNDICTIESASHPSPSIRCHSIMATIHTIFQSKYDTSIIDQISNICTNAALSAERIFDEISEQGLEMNHFAFSTNPKVLAHSRFLMRNWNNVRPLLEPFTYSSLAPLHVDEI